MSEPRPKPSKKNKNTLWPVKVFFLTFLLATLISMFSQTILLGVSLFFAILVLLFIILVGVVFDIIGIAVTAQDISAYTAMASKKIRGAKHAIRLVQSAGTVSNICNDVVGDICGIVSGAMGAAISASLILTKSGTEDFISSILLSSLIAAVTVGSKAIGKFIAMGYSHHIVFFVGKLFAFFSREPK